MTGQHTPSVSVVVINWNAGSLLERCVAALSQQTHSPNRIIVVDNASSDDSLTPIEKRYGDIEIVRLQSNIGFAAANNHAIAMLEDSDWVALVNPDAFPTPDWLEEMLRAARENPDYAFFGCRLVRAGDQDILDGTGDIYHVGGLAWRRDHGSYARTVMRDNEEIFTPCAAAAIYRRDALKTVNGFDESFFCYFEDIDLGFRLRLAGYRCLYVSSAVVYHQGSGTTEMRSDFSVYHGHRNLVWTYVKNMPAVMFWLYLPQHLWLNIVTIAWYVVNGRALTILAAKRDALLGLPKVWTRRQAIQRQKKVSAADLRKVMAKGWLLPYRRRHV